VVSGPSTRAVPTVVRRLLMSLSSAGLFVGVYAVAVRTAVGQKVDDRAFQLLYSLAPPGAVPLLAWFARGVVIVVLASLVALLAIAAVGRQSWRAVVVSVVIVGLTAVSTTYLRDEVLTRPTLTEETFPQNSMPSTHASVACALVVAAVVLWPRRPWWLVNSAGVVVLLAALGNVLGQAHRVSDVVASVLLAAAISYAALAVFGPTPTPNYPRNPS
jgi:membrane-associated phospholipid phosphatase